jgi:hypothetical protein
MSSAGWCCIYPVRGNENFEGGLHGGKEGARKHPRRTPKAEAKARGRPTRNVPARNVDHRCRTAAARTPPMRRSAGVHQGAAPLGDLQLKVAKAHGYKQCEGELFVYMSKA